MEHASCVLNESPSRVSSEAETGFGGEDPDSDGSEEGPWIHEANFGLAAPTALASLVEDQPQSNSVQREIPTPCTAPVESGSAPPAESSGPPVSPEL
eukprot:7300235-Pyramimonas_sp.AAC.1